MKKLILLSLIAIMMAGCDSRKVFPETESTNELRDGFRTYEANECEYWIYQNGHGGIPIHKGNCRFCAERRKQELKELVEELKK